MVATLIRHPIVKINMDDSDISSVSFSTGDRNKSGLGMEAKDISYSVLINGKMKRILKNVSLNVEPGEMCAIMGSSGSGKRWGKTTCLAIPAAGIL